MGFINNGVRWIEAASDLLCSTGSSLLNPWGSWAWLSMIIQPSWILEWPCHNAHITMIWLNFMLARYQYTVNLNWRCSHVGSSCGMSWCMGHSFFIMMLDLTTRTVASAARQLTSWVAKLHLCLSFCWFWVTQTTQVSDIFIIERIRLAVGIGSCTK